MAVQAWRETDMQGCDDAVWLRNYHQATRVAQSKASSGATARPGGLPSDGPSFSPRLLVLLVRSSGCLGPWVPLVRSTNSTFRVLYSGIRIIGHVPLCHVSLQPGALVHCKSYTLPGALQAAGWIVRGRFFPADAESIDLTHLVHVWHSDLAPAASCREAWGAWFALI